MTAAASYVPAPPQSAKEFETIYNMVRTDGIFMLKNSDLDLGNNLGKGNFGSVMSGTYRLRGKVIEVAVKVLKANDAAAEVSAVVVCSSHDDVFAAELKLYDFWPLSNLPIFQRSPMEGSDTSDVNKD